MPWPTAAKHSPAGDSCQPDPGSLDDLARRAPRLANVVEATSRRRDVRLLRSRLLTLMLELRCPPTVRAPRRSWYVPGALARVGAEGLRRAWLGFYGETPPCLRTVRAHLGALTKSCAIASSPGDWLPVLGDPEHPERRPRYPDTLHVLDTDAEATWWAQRGAALLEAFPGARYSPDTWRGTFKGWRQRAADAALDLAGTLFEGLEEPPIICRQGAGSAESSRAAVPPGAGCTPGVPQRLGDLLAGGARLESSPLATGAATLSPLNKPSGSGRGANSNEQQAAGFFRLAQLDRATAPELLVRARDLGLVVTGRNQIELCRDPDRLRGTFALLGMAYRRGDRIRNRAGWVVRNYRHVSADERRRALEACRRTQQWKKESSS